MKSGFGFASVIVVLGVLSLLAYLGADPDAARMGRALDTLTRLEFANAELDRDVLAARIGRLRNYDPINAAVDALYREADALRHDDVEPARLSDLREAIGRKEQLAESFKTDNALLQNSLAYFGLVSGRFSALALPGIGLDADPIPVHPEDEVLGSAVSMLATAMLRLTLDTSDAVAEKVDDSLLRLASIQATGTQSDLVGGLLQHGRLLRQLLPEAERVMASLHQVPLAQRVAAIRAALLDQQTRAAIGAARYRLGLYGVSVLLVALLAGLGQQLRRHIETLRRRIAFEHAIRTLAARFVTVDPSNLEQAIEEALQDIAVLLGAERGYALGAMLEVPVVWAADPEAAWPADWPGQAPSVAAAFDTDKDGTVVVPAIRLLARAGRKVPAPPAASAWAALAASGSRGWVCVSEDGFLPACLTIGFETLQRPLALNAADVSMLRVALSPLNHAVRRALLLREREVLEQQLQRARRLETIGSVTSGIAHNFNNIIAVILGYAEMETEGPSPRYGENLMGIQVAAERGRDLIDQILSFGRRQGALTDSVGVDALLQETVSLLSASLPSSVAIRVSTIPESAAIIGNHAELQQILLNLCSNAAQAMHGEKGTIDIATEIIRLSRRRTLLQGSLSPGSYVRIVVRDHGRGMGRGTINRVFEPFFTTRQSGNGLGLATVREIVRSHGGAIDIASSPGHGTRFEIWLPLAKSGTVQPALKLLPPVGGGGETILILGAERDILLRLEDLVAALGYEPVSFIGTATELDVFCKLAPGRFDAILVAPGGTTGSSINLARTARRVMPSLPIVIDVDVDEIDSGTLANIGNTEILARPLGSAELARALSRHLGQDRASDESSF